MEDTNYISSINPAPYNPRTLSDKNAARLKKSIDELGDLSGITVNIATGNQVTGHQRLALLKQHGNAQIVYTWRASETPQHGTTALGYIIHPVTGERFSYREVIFTPEIEKVANIAANHQNLQGEFDNDMLAQIDYELSQLPNADELLAQTGQDGKELERLLASVGVEPFGEQQPDELGDDPKDSDKLEFRLTREQREVVEEAIEHIKATREMAAEENGSRNGSALYYLAREHLDQLHGLTDESQAVQVESQNTNPSGELTDIPL